MDVETTRLVKIMVKLIQRNLIFHHLCLLMLTVNLIASVEYYYEYYYNN